MRLIDADVLKKNLRTIYRVIEYKENEEVFIQCLAITESDINAAETVDPVKHGHWETKKRRIDMDGFTLEGAYPTCSICGYSNIGFSQGSNYCPDCGARME